MRPTDELGPRHSPLEYPGAPVRIDSTAVIEEYAYLLEGVPSIERASEQLHGTVSTLLKLLASAHAMSLLYYFSRKQRPIRFTELTQATNASPKVLSQRLKELVESGLVTRHSYDESPPRVEYELTAMARELDPAFQFLYAWAARHDRVLSDVGSTENEATDALANAR